MRVTCRLRHGIALGLLACALPHPADAQEPPNAYESATQPGPGTFIYKPQWHYIHFGDDPARRLREADHLTLTNTLNFGLAPDWSLSLRVPLEQRWQTYRAGDHETSFGVGDFTTLAEWRIWRDDRGALDTQRLVLLGGMEWPSGQSEFSSHSFDPLLGAAYTGVAGRHGANLSAVWKFTTAGMRDPLLPGDSRADLLRYDAAYLYRLWPEEFSAETQGAWYAVIELNGLYETNGDHEAFIAPGLMYEARTWVVEFSVQLPAVQELDHRPESDVAVVLGLRFLF